MLVELNILTLNVWGIPFPFVVRDREVRIAAIGAELSTGRYDIVSLQEVWSDADCEKLRKIAEAVLPYSHYFYSGVIGAGLLVLSKYPIIGTLFHAWSVNGYFHRVHHADWFGGKGVGLCRILVEDRVVHLYNAHLHAEYDNENDEYKTHRVIQAFDTAQFIRTTRGDSVLQVLAGDLNTQPQDLTYKVLLYISKMRDCCKSKEIFTNECHRNSYTSQRALSKNPLGIRIDHIFVRTPDDIEVTVLDYSLPFPERVPGHKFSYSDHEAVLTKLRLSETKNSTLTEQKLTCSAGSLCSLSAITADADANGKIGNAGVTTASNIAHQHCTKDGICIDDPISQRMHVLHESVALCESSLQQLKIDRILYCSAAMLLMFLLVAFTEYTLPSGYKMLYLLLKFVLFGIILFCLFMGTVWNYMERNGVLAGKVSMEVMLRCIEIFELGLGK